MRLRQRGRCGEEKKNNEAQWEEMKCILGESNVNKRSEMRMCG